MYANKYPTPHHTYWYTSRQHQKGYWNTFHGSQRQQEQAEKIANENKLSNDTQAEIEKDIEKLPACVEKGRPMPLNFEYWLALFKILNYHVNKESFHLR